MAGVLERRWSDDDVHCGVLGRGVFLLWSLHQRMSLVGGVDIWLASISI